MRARTGKIARLPKPIREELNQRLHNGHVGWQIVAWLNQLPEVKHILAEHFGGRPISENNLSEWRLGGHQDWLGQIETRERVLWIAQNCQDPDSRDRLNSQTGILLAAALADAAKELREIEDNKARWARLRRLLHEFTLIRKGHTHDLMLQLGLEKARSHQTTLRTNAPKLGASST